MRWLCALLLCSLSACMTLYDDPDDVQVVSLNIGSGPFRNNEANGEDSEELIDIEVSTNTNYANFIRGYYVNVPICFCGDMHMRVEGLGGSGLYRHNNRWISVDDREGGNDTSPAPYHFHTFMGTFAHETHSMIYGEPAILDYDLRQIPRDICFYFNAGAMGLGVTNIRSNVVRIPKEVLIKFFAEHPRRTPSPAPLSQK